MARLTGSERDELAIYHHLKLVGFDKPYQTHLAEFANVLGMDDHRLERAILRLNEAKVLTLDLVSLTGYGQLSRLRVAADQNPGGLGNGPFEIRLTPSGFKYFEQVEDRIGPDSRIFISCGQYSEEERLLGKAVARIIHEATGRDAYFAQNQSGFDAVSTHILKALDGASGFVAIMHPRGNVLGPAEEAIGVRASVWVEQELAIAAFLAQAQGREIERVPYIHNDIMLEGLRSGIILNPVRFTSSADVLVDLQARLRDGLFAILSASAH